MYDRPSDYYKEGHVPRGDDLRRMIAALEGGASTGGGKGEEPPPPRHEEEVTPPPPSPSRSGWWATLKTITALVGTALVGFFVAKVTSDKQTEPPPPPSYNQDAYLGGSVGGQEVGSLASLNTANASSLAASRVTPHQAEAGAERVEYNRFGSPISYKGAYANSGGPGQGPTAGARNNGVETSTTVLEDGTVRSHTQMKVNGGTLHHVHTERIVQR